MAQLNTRLQEVEAQPSNPTALATKARSVEMMSAAVAKETARAAAKTPKALLPTPAAGSDRSRSLGALTRQMAASGLRLVTVSQVNTGNKTQGQPVTDVEWLSQKQNMPAPEYWRVELVGSYGQMLDALKALSSSAEFIIPLTIEMESAEKKSSDGKTLQKWALVVWI
jgi:hypothetical protein